LSGLETIQSIFNKTLLRILTVFLILTLTAATLVLLFEQNNNPEVRNLWDSVWWALVTVFTVGYGDIAPVTPGGRIVELVIMFAGASLESVITATISSIFVAKRIREDQGLEPINYDNHIIVCGWNNRAETILETIFLMSVQKPIKVVLVNELPDDKIHLVLDKFHQQKIKFTRGDYTRPAPLERANVKEAVAVILLPNMIQPEAGSVDDKTLLATLNIKSGYPKLRVIAFIVNPENEVHIRRAKADDIFISDQFTDFMIATNILKPGLTTVLRRILDPRTENLLTTMPIPPRMRGKTYADLFLYFKSQRLLLIGVLSEITSIGLSDFLSSDSSHLDAFIERKLREAGKTLGEENRTYVHLNPDDAYVIQENEQAIIIQ